MRTHTFYLQFATIGGKTSHSVAQTEETLTRPHANADWQRYKLTIRDGRIEALEKTDRFLTQPRTYTMETHKGQQVPMHKTTVQIGAPWETLRSGNRIVQSLIDLMDNVLLVPSPHT